MTLMGFLSVLSHFMSLHAFARFVFVWGVPSQELLNSTLQILQFDYSAKYGKLKDVS